MQVIIDGQEQKVAPCLLSDLVTAFGITAEHTVKVNDFPIPYDSKLQLNEDQRIVITSAAFAAALGDGDEGGSTVPTDGVTAEAAGDTSGVEVNRLLVYKSKTTLVNEKPMAFSTLPPKSKLRRVLRVLDIDPNTGDTTIVWDHETE
jgi:hypothetical protein